MFLRVHSRYKLGQNVPLVLHDYLHCADLENVFRGTFRVKKRDLPAKSGTVGRAHIEIFLEV